ncbi:MAG: SIS domain-containing protein [Bacteroidetes bacterium]|jgi:D-sedoheptulose 7-phosphate isomerase|nr:MAG: phosphoheptose isomerase [Cryomorphaceae bacterium BACL23 MAG-120924-bin60]MBL6626605.1 SIS domain-containing protein [Cryomorphaceae bacterium]MDA0363832.1 SIS domain-containing protein [Bacteroidota bacterium]NDA07165.1 SIS domain-containing protein [Flavobacteriia bacterium]MDA0828592.1 SIS domain-containing protein [Bacteroidota bacterium]
MTASEYRQLLTDTLNRLDMAAVDAMVECFADAHARGATIFTMGNGGSGASASHAAGDFLKGASYGLDQRFKMVCLNDNLPSMMAIANDIGWEDIFVEPLKNFIQPGDVVIGISGSGNSKNVLKAVDYAKSKGATVIGMTGFKGGQLREAADISIHSDAMDMEVAEDVHMAVFNMVKKVMMARLMGDTPSMGGTYDARVQ